MSKLMMGLAIPAICLAHAAPAVGQINAEDRYFSGQAYTVIAADKPQPRHQIKAQGVTHPTPAPASNEPIEQGYEIAPAMWLLSDDDTSIYMFGTFHVLPEGLRWRTAAFDAVLEEVDELVVETSDADSGAQLVEAMPQMAAMMEGQESISGRLTPKSAQKWRMLASLLGVSYETFDQMPVLLAMFSVGIVYSQQTGFQSVYGVETILEAEFIRAEKPIGSIENAGEVMLSLLTIDDDLMLVELENGLSQWNGASLEDFMSEPGKPGLPATEIGRFKQEHSWARGDLQPVLMEEFGAGEVGEQVYDVMLSRRNAAWAEWLENRLDRPGKVLLAVGAGHFAGRDSVIDLLAERGLEPERVQ